MNLPGELLTISLWVHSAKERRFVWHTNTPISRNSGFEVTSKRRKGYPSETHVKTGARVVHGDKELIEKLGRNDPCPCGSGKCFQKMLPQVRPLLKVRIATIM
jgi:hypothetical protein